MFGVGKKNSGGPSVKELAGVILSEASFIRIIQPEFDKRILHLSKEGNDYRLDFNPSESINAYILGQEDIVKLMMDYYGRTVIEVGLFEGGHQQYLVRFDE
jgi:hypothetical protein